MARLLLLASLAAVVLGFSAEKEVSLVQNVPHRYALNLGRAPQGDALMALEERLSGAPFVVTDRYTSRAGVTHTYVRQVVNGLEVVNGLANINVDAEGNILSLGESFYRGSSIHAAAPAVTPFEAVRALADHMGARFHGGLDLLESQGNHFEFEGTGLSLDRIPADLRYMITENGELELVWEVTLHNEVNWANGFVSALRPDAVLEVVDWNHWAKYNVFPIGVNDPDDGDRVLLTDPAHPTASPLGWHDTDDVKYTVTRGNNVQARENRQILNPDKYAPDGTGALDFDFDLDLNREPVESEDAIITNLFYWNNIVHDVFYTYGFDEPAGNFQKNNFGRGGRDNDEVIANAQDGLGKNNAVFSAPPDGQNGQMRMFLWTTPSGQVEKDGSLESGIMIHEYGHGINIRLAGGPSNSNCMSGGEAGGMGEGWGDWWSVILRWREEYSPFDMVFEMGEYAAGRGIRQRPYAYNFTLNEQTYETLNDRSVGGSVHATGAVWCTMMYNVFQNMVAQYGFDPNQYAGGKGANNVMLADSVLALQLQPCRPTFIETRDALLQANEQNYGGEHKCIYWREFARRGLGVSATSGSTNRNGFDLPPECQ